MTQSKGKGINEIIIGVLIAYAFDILVSYGEVPDDEKTSDNSKGNSIAPGSVLDYIKGNKAYADYTEKYYLVPAAFTLAQAGLESSWGTSEIARNSNNQFGIKADSSWKGDTYQGYRKYPTIQDSYNDHASFLVKNSRYSKAFDYTDPYQFAQAVTDAGYSEVPAKYGVLIKGVLNSVLSILN